MGNVVRKGIQPPCGGSWERRPEASSVHMAFGGLAGHPCWFSRLLLRIRGRTAASESSHFPVTWPGVIGSEVGARTS